MSARRLVALLTLLAAASLSQGVGPPPQRPPWPAPEADALRDAGVEAHGDVLAYVRAMTPSAAEGTALAALVRQLGDDSFRSRQTAAKKLTAGGLKALHHLRLGSADRDPETAKRCQALLRR